VTKLALSQTRGLVDQVSTSDLPSGDTDWAKRAEYWGNQKTPKPRNYAGRKDRQPLILSGHGVRLSVDHGALLVQNGFTHYPQKREEWRLFPGDRRLPSRIVILDSSGSLSFDVMTWLSTKDIPLVQINWQGEVVTMLGGAGHSADSKKVAAQRDALQNGQGLQIAIQLIQDKINGCMETLEQVLPASLERERALTKQTKALTVLEGDPPSTMEALRLIEGRAALAYFTAWQTIPLRWKGVGKRPIPHEWQRVGLRQSSLSGTNRHATHPVNALLNYAYGLLETEVRIAVVAAGLDPTIGYLHARRPGRVALVYDLMEPLRPRVDQDVLGFVQKHIFSPGDFVMTNSGACRLHSKLAHSITRSVVTDSAEIILIALQGVRFA
jgi:CRISPR-associated endonuclease Cas1